ncbi:hypothetical protein [Delftia acidovorans]|uniref:hypothetical protein n=1 Tax=Delftia acidovorans TaxID=80866 RepID=UPI000BE3E39C|nr:hypothetical protein [Delftia acidovorans]
MDQEEEINKLRQEVDALRQAIKTLLAQAQAMSQLAMALATTHPDPKALLVNFDALVAASEGPLLHSKATEQDLAEIEQFRAVVRGILLPGST